MIVDYFAIFMGLCFMGYVEKKDRYQLTISNFDALVDPKSTARLIDAFVDSLELNKYDIKECKHTGRPPYDPKDLLKLYIYGCVNAIRSSRKLQNACKVNIEVMWMLGGVTPDFRTIADFRKENVKALKKIFHEFNRRLSGEVEWGFSSVDGSKFKADNSKDNNFTSTKLDDRIKWLTAHTEEYLRILDQNDSKEDDDPDDTVDIELVKEKLKEAKDRLAKYEYYQKYMEENGLSQMSLTDADARLMKNKNGFDVSYNPQTAVDSETHLIHDFQMTNQVTDHGLLASTMEGIKAENPDKVVDVAADKGYNKEEDMIDCLEKGIMPHVITDDGKDGYNLEVPYEEKDVDPASTKAEDLKDCLHAGVIPDAYKDVISDMKVKEVRKKVSDEPEHGASGTGSVYGTQEEMVSRAKEGYFVRDPERNIVYCPSGTILRQKSIKNTGKIRYANKSGCKSCPFRNKCIEGKGEWKEIDFSKDQLEKPNKKWLAEDGRKPDDKGKGKTPKGKWHYEKRKVVKFTLKPDIQKTSQRMCLSEHPFGTIKRAMGAGYFLLKGLKKVEGEFALMCLGYNIKRAKNLLGFDKMMELMVTE